MSPAERKQLEEIYKIIFSLKQRVNAARASIEKKESASKTEEKTDDNEQP